MSSSQAVMKVDVAMSIILPLLAVLGCGLGACVFFHRGAGRLLGGAKASESHCAHGADSGRTQKLAALLLSALGCGLIMLVVAGLAS